MAQNDNQLATRSAVNSTIIKTIQNIKPQTWARVIFFRMQITCISIRPHNFVPLGQRDWAASVAVLVKWTKSIQNIFLQGPKQKCAKLIRYTENKFDWNKRAWNKRDTISSSQPLFVLVRHNISLTSVVQSSTKGTNDACDNPENGNYEPIQLRKAGFPVESQFQNIPLYQNSDWQLSIPEFDPSLWRLRISALNLTSRILPTLFRIWQDYAELSRNYSELSSNWLVQISFIYVWTAVHLTGGQWHFDTAGCAEYPCTGLQCTLGKQRKRRNPREIPT